MYKCRLFSLIVQLLCISLVAAPVHSYTTLQHTDLVLAGAKSQAGDLPSSNNELNFPQFTFQQLMPDELFQEIIIPLNTDLSRSRLSIHSKLIQPYRQQLIFSSVKNDATTIQVSASYYFSSTNFHSYLFRLKPF
jgi:hypothetical protein